MQKVINFDNVTEENINENNLHWPQIPYHPYKKLIIGGSGSAKTNLSFILISHYKILTKFILMLKIHMKQNINC